MHAALFLSTMRVYIDVYEFHVFWSKPFDIPDIRMSSWKKRDTG